MMCLLVFWNGERGSGSDDLYISSNHYSEWREIAGKRYKVEGKR